MTNPFGKTRSEDKPYAIYTNHQGWVWKVLKTYKKPENEKKDSYARWFVSATSPLMHDGGYEMGDTYIKDILTYGSLLEASPEWKKHYSDEDADKFDPHIVCFSWPNCDESPLGCVVRNGLDAEPYGHKD